MHHRSVLSPFLFTVVVDVGTEFAIEGALSELLHADDLVLMSETIEGLRNKFIKWNDPWYIFQGEKGDRKELKKFHVQKVQSKYCLGSCAQRKYVMKWKQ